MCLDLTKFCHGSGAIRIVSPLECCKRHRHIANRIFNSSLRTLILEYAPSISPQMVIDTGANGIRNWDAVSDGTVLCKVVSA